MTNQSNNLLAWVEIDLGAVTKNIYALKAMLAPTVRFCAVVKSNAYGHGLVPIAKTAIESGADWLAVIDPNEARAIRDAGIAVPILITGVVAESEWPWLAAHGVRITIGDQEQLKYLVQYRGPALTVHLKVETGLGRLGFLPDDISDVVQMIQENPTVILEGISSHFASVEEQDLEYTARQVAEFRRATSLITVPTLLTGVIPEPVANRHRESSSTGSPIKSGMTMQKHEPVQLIRHIAATAALMQLPHSHFDMVRAGIGIYGLWPSEGVRQAMRTIKPDLELFPALSFRARIVQVKIVPAGTTVGYGRTHKLTRDTQVAVVAVGYADGYDRGLSSKASVLIHGQRCPVIGRVAMNMIMVNCSMVPEVQAGDVATLIGRDGDEIITADDLATWADAINYEIVTRLPAHIQRKYNN